MKNHMYCILNRKGGSKYSYLRCIGAENIIPIVLEEVDTSMCRTPSEFKNTLERAEIVWNNKFQNTLNCAGVFCNAAKRAVEKAHKPVKRSNNRNNADRVASSNYNKERNYDRSQVWKLVINVEGTFFSQNSMSADDIFRALNTVKRGYSKAITRKVERAAIYALRVKHSIVVPQNLYLSVPRDEYRDQGNKRSNKNCTDRTGL